jgi:hypothetical protein
MGNVDQNGANPPSTGVLEQGLALLKSSLPKSWEVLTTREGRSSARQMADALVTLRTSTMMSPRIVVEAYQAFAPRDVNRVVGGRSDVLRELSGGSPVLVMAPWLSERSRSLLKNEGINYLDLTGNVWLELSGMPGLFIDRVAKVQGGRSRQSEVNLRGPKAGRVIRLLADVTPPYSGFDLASAGRVTPGYVSKILESLEKQALVERTSRGAVERVEWADLLRLRATTYEVFKTNSATFFVAPEGPNSARERLRDTAHPALTLTGSFAAEEFVRVAAPNLLTLYVEKDPSDLISELSLLPADQGANVVLMRPYDDSVVARPRRREPPGWLPATIKKVACAQLALDCLTGTGRMPAEGEALLKWMGENEAVWRYPSLSATPPWA